VQNLSLPDWIKQAADANRDVTVGRALNPGEQFGPGNITLTGAWGGHIHATTDMDLIDDLLAAGRSGAGYGKINLSDLDRLAKQGKITFGDNMREIRIPDQHCREFSGLLKPR
jgi:hypothetical protein